MRWSPTVATVDRAKEGRENLGRRLRELRLERGLTLRATAEAAGMSLPYLSEIERGRKLPSLDLLHHLAAALGLSTVQILEGVAPYDVEPGG